MQVFDQVFSWKSQVFSVKRAPKADAPDGCFPSFKTSRVANKVSTEEAGGRQKITMIGIALPLSKCSTVT